MARIQCTKCGGNRVLIDGYDLLGTEILEGIEFLCSLNNGKWNIVTNDPTEGYLQGLDMKFWLNEMRTYAEDLVYDNEVIGVCPNCDADVEMIVE